MPMSEEEIIAIRFRLECYKSTNLGQPRACTTVDYPLYICPDNQDNFTKYRQCPDKRGGEIELSMDSSNRWTMGVVKKTMLPGANWAYIISICCGLFVDLSNK